MAPALLWFWGEPPFAYHPPTPHPGIAHFGIGRKGGMWQVFEGGGRAREVAGGRMGGLEGPRRSQRPCRNAAAGAQASRPPPAWAEASGAVESGQGDHGFRLHSGQSFPGTPGRPGSRTGTRPAGGNRGSAGALLPRRLPGLPRAAPLLGLACPSHGLTLHPNALPSLCLQVMYVF